MKECGCKSPLPQQPRLASSFGTVGMRDNTSQESTHGREPVLAHYGGPPCQGFDVPIETGAMYRREREASRHTTRGFSTALVP